MSYSLHYFLTITKEQYDANMRLADFLESKQIKQGRGCLRQVATPSEMTYCCLGAACELFRLETGRGEWVGPGNHNSVDLRFKFVVVVGKEGLCGFEFPPEEVAEYFGWPSTNPLLEGESSMTRRNDVLQEDFNVIARALRETVNNLPIAEGPNGDNQTNP